MKIMLISLGCDKNRVDSEYMLGRLSDAGFFVTDDENEAEAVIINSCCFIGDAKEESINTIIEMAELKKTAKLKRLVVAGCLAQRYAEDIKRELPEVDAIIGTMAIDAIAEAVNAEGFYEKREDINRRVPAGRRMITGESYVSFLKIAEGCDKHCTYCVIPSVRGNYRSFPMEDLVNEARYLAENGTRELILVAQETTLYGVDLYGKKQLHVLLEKLSEIEDLGWIRVMYCYPEEIYDELLETMNRLPKVVKYLDIPVQHASDAVLKAMGRHTTGKELLAVIKNIRKKVPGIALRTSLITGFPGETEKDVDKLAKFIEKARFTRLGVFTYSREEGTAADKMDGHIKESEKKKRRSRLMKLAGEISKEDGKKLVGSVLPVIIEGYMPDEEVYVGRTYRDAPDVDGCVFVYSDEKYLSGDIVDVRITKAKKYDLTGESVQV